MRELDTDQRRDHVAADAEATPAFVCRQCGRDTPMALLAASSGPAACAHCGAWFRGVGREPVQTTARHLVAASLVEALAARDRRKLAALLLDEQAAWHDNVEGTTVVGAEDIVATIAAAPVDRTLVTATDVDDVVVAAVLEQPRDGTSSRLARWLIELRDERVIAVWAWEVTGRPAARSSEA